MSENYYIFIFLAFVAEVLGTVSGFGSSILFVPVASLFFDFKSVLGITAVFHVFSNLSKIALFRNGIKKDIALKLGIPAVIFVIIGAWLTTFLPTKSIELAMNVLLVFLAVYL
ncbi:MAG TPA: sulfite exporter TauE/SafE family protein, partial [Saprospiraceae bacterium]|nr:sulfite exporter TauE/SafE family protein [Saprospiraceae bacterium]